MRKDKKSSAKSVNCVWIILLLAEDVVWKNPSVDSVVSIANICWSESAFSVKLSVRKEMISERLFGKVSLVDISNM